MKQRDEDMKQVMAEESSRGRRRPVRATDLEIKRQFLIVKRLLADRNCDRRKFMAVLREEFGHQDGSPMFLKYLKAWDELRPTE
jgi:hypothetical protein